MFTQCMVQIKGYLRAQNSHKHMYIGAVQIEMKYIIYIYHGTVPVCAICFDFETHILSIVSYVVQSIHTTCTIFYILNIRIDLYIKREVFFSNLWNFGTISLMESTADLIRSNLSSQGTGDCWATLLNPNLFWCT